MTARACIGKCSRPFLAFWATARLLCSSHSAACLKLKVLCFDTFAICVQVLTSPKDIEMWGDGLQTRSFTFIDDCVEGILRITKSDYKEPLNLGSSEMVRSLPSVVPF